MKLATLLCIASITAGCGDSLLVPVDGASVDAPVSVVIDAAGSAQSIDAAEDSDGGPVGGGGDGGITLACSIPELVPVFTCAQTACVSDPSLTCVLSSCGLLLFGLSSSCQQCLLTALTSGDLTATLGACIGGLPSPIAPT